MFSNCPVKAPSVELVGISSQFAQANCIRARLSAKSYSM
ncbi:hypothetical protein SAMN06265374_4247 [Roseibium denhamense]|uniref:Uncharacterized protein n=1 Tax=Roseibium denhamense TaxID=76305 RepID=A0ABY1PQE9_9HYPH|nr:hypothetical protein SAMN06265374_4247 [Roseibium denhamense]